MDSELFRSIAQIGGGLFAIACILAVGVRFYRRESNFSEEYIGLIDQYKIRNAELQKQNEELINAHSREIAEMKAGYESRMSVVQQQVAELTRQVETLKQLLLNK